MAKLDTSAIYSDISTYDDRVIASYKERNTLYDGLEIEYLMNRTSQDKDLEAANPSIALTKSPDSRNQVKGVVRLLTTTRPEVSMPVDKNDEGRRTEADDIEMLGDALLAVSDRYNRRPLHYDAALSAVLYDEIHIAIHSTADILSAAEELSPAKLARVERLSKDTPYLFEILNPRDGYPVWDMYGLASFISESNLTIGDVLDRYPRAREIMQAKSGKGDIDNRRLEYTTLRDHWDLTYRCVYLTEYDGWLMCEEHGLPFIPRVASTAEGSGLFHSPESQREPFLMTSYKSGLSQRKTEALTAMATLSRTYGFSPAFVVGLSEASQEIPTLKQIGLFQLFVLGPGQTLQPLLNKGIIDPSTMTAFQIWQQLGEESTIFKSTLGGSQAGTYSETALLSQLGRIPLETVRRMTGRAMADALEIAFTWARFDKRKGSIFNANRGKLAEFDWSNLPENINLDVELEVSLPQDKIGQATAASVLREKGLASLEWIHENVMGVRQSAQMVKQIWKERFKDLMFQQAAQKMMQPPAPPQPMPQEGTQDGMPSMPPGMTPEMMQGGMQGPEMPVQEQQMQPPEVM